MLPEFPQHKTWIKKSPKWKWTELDWVESVELTKFLGNQTVSNNVYLCEKLKKLPDLAKWINKAMKWIGFYHIQ